MAGLLQVLKQRCQWQNSYVCGCDECKLAGSVLETEKFDPKSSDWDWKGIVQNLITQYDYWVQTNYAEGFCATIDLAREMIKATGTTK